MKVISTTPIHDKSGILDPILVMSYLDMYKWWYEDAHANDKCLTTPSTYNQSREMVVFINPNDQEWSSLVTFNSDNN